MVRALYSAAKYLYASAKTSQTPFNRDNVNVSMQQGPTLKGMKIDLSDPLKKTHFQVGDGLIFTMPTTTAKRQEITQPYIEHKVEHFPTQTQLHTNTAFNNNHTLQQAFKCAPEPRPGPFWFLIFVWRQQMR